MRSIIFAICIMAAFTLSNAQESLSAFNRVSVKGSVQLTLKKGETTQYTATGDTDKLKVEVKDGRLKISRIDITDAWQHPAVVTVWYTDLNQIAASAGAEILHDGTLNAGDIELAFDSGSGGAMTIDATSIDLVMGQGSSFKLDGATKVFDGKVTTGAVLKARDLVAHRAYINANTGGSATVQATEEIDAEASTGGSISYWGDPQIVRESETLGGSIRG